ncbi:hypothetical protein THAOC_20515, partial [Thalassiosira oceanica]
MSRNRPVHPLFDPCLRRGKATKKKNEESMGVEGRKREGFTGDDVFLYEGVRSEVKLHAFASACKSKIFLARRSKAASTWSKCSSFNEGSLQAIGDFAFFECTGLQQVTIPASVTKLGRRAFQGCTKLFKVKITDGALQVIEEGAFCGREELQQVTIPQSVSELGRHAFKFCINLTKANLEKAHFVA